MLKKIKWFFLIIIVLIISPFILVFGSIDIKKGRIFRFIKKIFKK